MGFSKSWGNDKQMAKTLLRGAELADEIYDSLLAHMTLR